MGVMLTVAILLVVQAAGPEMVPDPTWVPKPGDEANLFDKDGESVYVTKDMFAFEKMIKSIRARDTDGLKELAGQGRLVLVPSKTPMLVLKRHTNQFLADGVHALEIRVREGEYRGQTGWMMEMQAARLIPKPPPPPTPASKKATEKAPDPEARAAALFDIARALEASDKGAVALTYYRRIVGEYPETAAAKKAIARISALEKP